MLWFAYITGLFIFADVSSATHLTYSIETYSSVMTSLLSNYSRKIRPIKQQGQSLQMSVSFYLANINEVSTTEQKMSTTGYLAVKWTDELLNWNNVSTGMYWMQFNQKDIWIPDIVVKNGLKEFKMMGGDFYYNFVYSTGEVYWYPYAVFETSCDLNVKYFPFDTQQCSIIIKSWSYSRWEVNFTFGDPKIGFYEFVPNSIWDLVSFDGTTDYSSSNTDLFFNFKLKRKPQYFVLNLILPIIFVGILTLVVFMIPADAGEKMGYSVTIFLAFAVFLTIVSAELPVNSDTPSVLSIYLIIELGVSIISLTISSVQLRLNHRKPSRKIGEGFRMLVRFGRKLRCEKSKGDDSKRGCFPIPCRKSVQPFKIDEADSIGTMAMHKKENDMEDEEEIEWSDVSSAIDFFSFWVLFLAQTFVTIVVFSYIALG